MGSVIAGKDLFAKYMTNVCATVGRDATIERELNDCTMRVGRSLLSPTCSIVRGDITVGMQSEVFELGCEGGGRTTVRLGANEQLENITAQVAELQTLVSEQAAKAKAKLDEVKNVKGKKSAAHAEMLTELEFAYQTQQRMLKNFMKGVTKLCQLATAHTRPSLTVHGCIYPGAMVQCGDWSCTFHQQVRGPVRIEVVGDQQPTLAVLKGDSVVALNKVAKISHTPRRADLRKVAHAIGLDFDALAALAA
jgi:hypothetical protein